MATVMRAERVGTAAAARAGAGTEPVRWPVLTIAAAVLFGAFGAALVCYGLAWAGRWAVWVGMSGDRALQAASPVLATGVACTAFGAAAVVLAAGMLVFASQARRRALPGG